MSNFSVKTNDRDFLEESFTLYDTVGDHKIDINMLGEVLRGLGLNPTNNDVESIVKELGSATRMSFEEFLPIYESMSSRMETKKSKTAVDFLECFRVFDREQNGTINIGELKHVMSTLGEGLTLDEINDLTKGIESKGDGMVSIEEFVNTVMSG